MILIISSHSINHTSLMCRHLTLVHSEYVELLCIGIIGASALNRGEWCWIVARNVVPDLQLAKVFKIIKPLSRGKFSGHDDLCIEHLQNATPHLTKSSADVLYVV